MEAHEFDVVGVDDDDDDDDADADDGDGHHHHLPRCLQSSPALRQHSGIDSSLAGKRLPPTWFADPWALQACQTCGTSCSRGRGCEVFNFAAFLSSQPSCVLCAGAGRRT